MRHPFDGIVAPKANRRSWLKVFAGAIGGWFGYAAAAGAVGPPRRVRTEPDASPEPGKPVTKALIPAETGGNRATFTVRKVSFSQGVERIFPLHSPTIQRVEVVRSAKVRRAKLYFLRDLKGKAARMKEVKKA